MLGFDCMRGSGNSVQIKVKSTCCNKTFTLQVTDEMQVEELVAYVKELQLKQKAVVKEN